MRLHATILLLLLCGTAAAQPRLPQTGIAIALAEAERLPPEVARNRLYFWCPAGSKDELVTALDLTNTVLSQVSDDVRPAALAQGAVVAVDLAACCQDEKDLTRLLHLRERLAELDPWFHIHTDTVTEVDEPCPPYRHTDGKTYSARKVKKTVRAAVPIPELGPDLLRLDQLCGSGSIQHVGFAASKLLLARDDGLYYEARGLDAKLTLDQYVRTAGIDPALVDRISAEDAELNLSQITGRARATRFWSASDVKPSVGSSALAVTQDNFEDAATPDRDPFRSLLDHKPDGREVMRRMRNGRIEWTLWDGQGRIAKVAPQNLVTDRTVPSPFPTQLSPPLSCIRCHAAHEEWQPIRQEFKEQLSDRANLLSDLSKGESVARQFEQYSKVRQRTSGDLDEILTAGRRASDRAAFRQTRLGIRDLSEAVSRVATGYIYGLVGAKEMLYDLGVAPEPNDPTGVFTFRKIVPARGASGYDQDDALVVRLHTLAMGSDGTRQPLRLTRRQAESIYADCLQRAAPALKRLAEQPAQPEPAPGPFRKLVD